MVGENCKSSCGPLLTDEIYSCYKIVGQGWCKLLIVNDLWDF